MRAEIRFTESALGDLEGIRARYAEQGVGDVGDRLVADIVEREPREVRGDAESAAPGAISLLERLVDARNPNRSDLGNRRRLHRLDHHPLRRHLVHRLVERLPERPELPRLLRLGEDRHGRVDLLLGHVALVAVLDLAHRLADHRRLLPRRGKSCITTRIPAAVRVRCAAAARAGPIGPARVPPHVGEPLRRPPASTQHRRFTRPFPSRRPLS